MVEFWSNHLNVTNTSDGVWDNRQDYDRRVIRAHALGKFSDMLAASAAHPAMLEYLNQGESTKTAPNENYGRELLELHTVGVDAGYTEAMVLDSARIMTGYTIQWEESSPRYREFRLRPVDPLDRTGPGARLLPPQREGRRTGRRARLPRLPRTAPGHRAQHRAQARGAVRRRHTPSAALVGRLASVYRSRRHEHRPGAACAVHVAGVPRLARARRCGGRTRT